MSEEDLATNSEQAVPLIQPFGPPSPRWGEEGDRRRLSHTTEIAFGETVVAAARGWIGTPYRHQGSLKGIGCDCLGLVRGVWRDLYGEEPERPSAYQPDWAERGGEERLIAAALRHFGAALPVAEMGVGDVLLFRWRAEMPAKHAGILSGDGRFIHAYEQAAVIESELVPSWRRRIAAVFRFPVKG